MQVPFLVRGPYTKTVYSLPIAPREDKVPVGRPDVFGERGSVEKIAVTRRHKALQIFMRSCVKRACRMRSGGCD